jgi:hypothetical protein
MLSTLLSPYSLFLVLILTALLIAGVIAAVELWFSIFPVCVTSVNDRVLEACYRSVTLVAIVFFATAILRRLIGGGINAL